MLFRSTLHPRLLEVIQHRAGVCPLRVRMKLRNTFPPVPKHGLDWCIQNFGRIKALSLQSDLLDDFTRLSNANGSSIVALELSYTTDGTGSGTLAKICNDSTPQLRTLRLYGIRLPWQRKRYSNLTSITVVIPDGVLEDDKNIIHIDRKSTRLNSSHSGESRMPSSA